MKSTRKHALCSPAAPRPPVTRGDDKCVPAGPWLGPRNRDAPGTGNTPKSGRRRARRQAGTQATNASLSSTDLEPEPVSHHHIMHRTISPPQRPPQPRKTCLTPPASSPPPRRAEHPLPKPAQAPHPCDGSAANGERDMLGLLVPSPCPALGRAAALCCSPVTPGLSEGAASLAWGAHAARYCSESSRLTPPDSLAPDSRPTIPVLLAPSPRVACPAGLTGSGPPWVA